MTNQVANTVMIPVEEYEALRLQVEELNDGLTIAYMAGHAKGADQLAAMTADRDQAQHFLEVAVDERDHYLNLWGNEYRLRIESQARSSSCGRR